MRTQIQTQPVKLPHGVGMIEVLITVLVLSIGLLGVAALQGFSLRGAQVSYERTQATNIVYELLDHMRANRSIVLDSGSIPDFEDFQERVVALLPGTDFEEGSVNIDTADGTVTITIQWADDERLQEDGESEPWEFTVSSRI